MERKGAVNQYMPYVGGELVAEGGKTVLRRAALSALSAFPPVFTLNLADGTTPFIKRFHGREYSSECYRLSRPPIVTHAWYRPRKDEFDQLEEWTRDHVLNGGLLCLELIPAVNRQLAADPVSHEWGYERFQAFCLECYGVRRPPQDAPTKK